MFIGLVLLPLRRRWPLVGNDRGRNCEGLVLIPAGPGIVRRIGLFVDLYEYKIEDIVEHGIEGIVEQEVTIV